MHDRRFASLRGHSRSLLEDFDDLELDDVFEEEPDLDAVFGDPPHDGWSELVPLYDRMRELARGHYAYDR